MGERRAPPQLQYERPRAQHRRVDRLGHGADARAAGRRTFMGTNHQGLGALQDGERVEMDITNIGRLAFNVVDPLKRRWPRGADEMTAADIRMNTGAPGTQSTPLH